MLIKKFMEYGNNGSINFFELEIFELNKDYCFVKQNLASLNAKNFSFNTILKILTSKYFISNCFKC